MIAIVSANSRTIEHFWVDYDNPYEALGNSLLQPFVLFYQAVFFLGGSKLDQQIHWRLLYAKRQ